MARAFNGSTAFVNHSPGGMAGWIESDAMSGLAIVRRGATGNWHSVFAISNTALTTTYTSLEFTNANQLTISGTGWSFIVNGTGASAGFPAGWYIVGFSVTASTVVSSATCTLHFTPLAASSFGWVHATTAAGSSGTRNAANPGATATTIEVGRWSTSDAYNGDIQRVALWRGVTLSNAQIESCGTSLRAWLAVGGGPTFLAEYDQPATTTNVVDLTGKGGNQSSTANTTISTNAAPFVHRGSRGMLSLYGLGGGSTPISGSESFTFTETASIAITTAVTEAVAASDLSSINAALAASDAFALTDLSSLLVVTALSANDAITLSDLVSALERQSALTEVVAASEALSIAAAVAASDSGVATDAASLLMTMALAASDTFTATDASSLFTGTSLSASDSSTATDNTPSIAAALTVTESAVATEALSVVAALAANDAFTGTDASSVLAGVALSVSDTMTVSDASSILASVGASDALVVTDQGVLTMTQFLNVIDSASLSEAAAVAAIQSLAVSDSITTTDAAVVLTGVVPPSIKLPTTVSLPVWAASAVIASRLSHVTIPARTTTVEVPEYASEVDLG